MPSLTNKAAPFRARSFTGALIPRSGNRTGLEDRASSHEYERPKKKSAASHRQRNTERGVEDNRWRDFDPSAKKDGIQDVLQEADHDTTDRIRDRGEISDRRTTQRCMGGNVTDTTSR